MRDGATALARGWVASGATATSRLATVSATCVSHWQRSRPGADARSAAGERRLVQPLRRLAHDHTGLARANHRAAAVRVDACARPLIHLVTACVSAQQELQCTAILRGQRQARIGLFLSGAVVVEGVGRVGFLVGNAEEFLLTGVHVVTSVVAIAAHCCPTPLRSGTRGNRHAGAVTIPIFVRVPKHLHFTGRTPCAALSSARARGAGRPAVSNASDTSRAPIGTCHAPIGAGRLTSGPTRRRIAPARAAGRRVSTRSTPGRWVNARTAGAHVGARPRRAAKGGSSPGLNAADAGRSAAILFIGARRWITDDKLAGERRSPSRKKERRAPYSASATRPDNLLIMYHSRARTC